MGPPTPVESNHGGPCTFISAGILAAALNAEANTALRQTGEECTATHRNADLTVTVETYGDSTWNAALSRFQNATPNLVRPVEASPAPMLHAPENGEAMVFLRTGAVRFSYDTETADADALIVAIIDAVIKHTAIAD